jgi:hypothetical protein
MKKSPVLSPQSSSQPARHSPIVSTATDGIQPMKKLLVTAVVVYFVAAAIAAVVLLL